MPDEIVHTVTLKLGTGYEFTASFDRLPEVTPFLLDEPPPLGENHGPNAAAMLATAVGQCLAASLVFCMRKSRVEITGLTAQVAAKAVRNEKGRFRVTGINVELAPSVAPADATRLDRCAGLFEDFCMVTESVRKGIPVTVTLKTPQDTYSV